MKYVYDILVRKHDKKRQIGRPISRWKDNIKWLIKKEGLRKWAGFIWP
jgi:hypothetical protein